MTLDAEVREHSKTLKTNSYSMSVNELATMYREGELDLHPEFQRFFRWTTEQKSRLVESLLLGIPVPPIFVSERQDSKWDVIDGLQRLSTILEFMGELLDEDGKTMRPLVLSGTHYLPGLDGLYWNNASRNDNVQENEYKREEFIPEFAKIRLKRARLDINIVQNTSDPDVKYEVFQRLNTGGSAATEQEIRNCLLLMADRTYFAWLKNLSMSENYRRTLSLTDKAIDEAFDMELISRLLVFTSKEIRELQRIDELGSYLNRESVAQARDAEFPRQNIQEIFEKAFAFLADILQENSFRRYDVTRQRYTGPMLVSLFEVVAGGLCFHLRKGGNLPEAEAFAKRHKTLWSDLAKKPFVGSGVRASTRVPETISFGRDWVTK